MKAGLNLYSLKNLIKTESDFIKTAKELKQMGYDFMQFSGAPYDSEMLKRVVDESGLPIVLTHAPFDLIINTPEKLYSEHLSFGCNYVGLGALPAEYRESEDKLLGVMDKLNESAKIIAEMGGKFFYHHHHYEFIRLSCGKTQFEYMVENCPNINFTLDTYWLQYAGQNPETTPLKLKGRINCVHLKDYRINDSFNPEFAPLSMGSLNFEKIIENCRIAGTEYFLVEQDNAFSYENPLEQVKISIDYLKR